MKFILVVLGVVCIFEGMPWFLSPSGFKKALYQMMQMSNSSLRITGLIFMLAGLWLVHLGVQ